MPSRSSDNGINFPPNESSERSERVNDIGKAITVVLPVFVVHWRAIHPMVFLLGGDLHANPNGFFRDALVEIVILLAVYAKQICRQ